MNTAPRIIGNHAYWFHDGAAYTLPEPAGNAGREKLPGPTDTGWIDVGVVSTAKIESKTEERPIFRPSPGRLKKYDVLETKDELTATLTVEEMSPLTFQTLFRTADLEADSTTYAPLAGGPIKGWLRVEQYDHEDQLFNTVNLYCHLKANGAVDFGDDVARTELVANVLYSSKNAGTLA